MVLAYGYFTHMQSDRLLHFIVHKTFVGGSAAKLFTLEK